MVNGVFGPRGYCRSGYYPANGHAEPDPSDVQRIGPEGEACGDSGLARLWGPGPGRFMVPLYGHRRRTEESVGAGPGRWIPGLGAKGLGCNVAFARRPAMKALARFLGYVMLCVIFAICLVLSALAHSRR